MVSQRRNTKPRFVSGSIMRHVVIMAGTGAIGLMAIFAVDLLNFGYISHLGNPAFTAAIAFSASLFFVLSAISIGVTIGLGATIGRLLGERRRIQARRTVSVFLCFVFAAAVLMGLIASFFATDLAYMVGARGEALKNAVMFLHFTLPTFPLLCMGMGLSALLRASGLAAGAMRVTLSGAICTAIVDPILIFWLGLGLEGAAITTIISRCVITASGLWNLRHQGLLGRPRLSALKPALASISRISAPAVLTNLATPVGGLYVTHAMSRFGLEAVSAQAVLDRAGPVAFAFVFALTGSVGPIMAQNLGARQISRVRETFLCALKLTSFCVLAMWGIFAITQNLFVKLFSVTGPGIPMVHIFCSLLVASYMFVGLLFVSNTAFNNLGHPLYSTFFNWGRATLGTIPFVSLGAALGGPVGILWGSSLGVTLFGSLAMIGALKVINGLEARYRPGLPADISVPTPKEAPSAAPGYASAEE